MRTPHTIRHGLNRPAFTLAELVVVVLILSIMTAIAVPQYTNSVARFNADAGARRIKADLEYLRHLARRKSAPQSIVFNPTTHSYTLTGVANMDLSSRTYTVELDQVPYSANLASADCGGDTTLRFDGFGQPDSAATIVVSSGDYQRTVTVEPTAGKVDVQ